MWNKHITHLEAEKLNAQLHSKFKGGLVRNSANFIEDKVGGEIRDLLSPRSKLRAKYYQGKVHECGVPKSRN